MGTRPAQGRSPLFAAVVRALRLARWSLRSGEQPTEVAARAAVLRRAHRLSRRDLLAASAGALGGLALSRCASLAPASRRGEAAPVVVVGAGIAGLTAAYRLRQAGVAVRVLEAQERVGGRMYSLAGRFADDQVVELGGELIDTDHTAIRSLAAELEMPLDDLSREEPGLALDVWWFGGARRGEEEVVEAFLPVAERIRADLATIRGDGSVSYRRPNGAQLLDRLTIAAWLERAGVDGWLRDLLDVAYTTEYGLELGEQSALNLLLLIDPEPPPFRVFGASDERFHVRGGNDRIPRELAARLGSDVELGTRLEAVREDSDGRLRLSLSRGGSAREERCEHLLLALPFTLLREVRLDVPLSPVKRRAIAQLGYGTNAKLMVGFAERVWRSVHRSNGSTFADLPYQSTWETSRHQAGSAGILTNFTGGRHGVELGRGTAAEQAARLVADLETVFPGVAAARAGSAEARFHWPSFPWTRGSYASYRPGQWTTIGGSEGEAEGRVHFAGEHCSLVAQGFMEGGCETGERAACEILGALGRPCPQGLPQAS